MNSSLFFRRRYNLLFEYPYEEAKGGQHEEEVYFD